MVYKDLLKPYILPYTSHQFGTHGPQLGKRSALYTLLYPVITRTGFSTLQSPSLSLDCSMLPPSLIQSLLPSRSPSSSAILATTCLNKHQVQDFVMRNIHLPSSLVILLTTCPTTTFSLCHLLIRPRQELV